MTKLLIIDGYGLIYRSFYAVESNAEKTCKSVFFSSFLNILENSKCTHLVFAMDSKKETFRKQLYPQYKANREKTPEELHKQIDEIKDILKEFNIQQIERNGLEADDIIAGLSRTIKADEINIASADKDLLQLVDDEKKIFVLRPSVFTTSSYEKYNSDTVFEKYGINANYMATYLSLIGDDSDNVPGVKGIGKKSAEKLVNAYGDLKSIYDNVESEKDAIKKKLLNSKEDAFLSYSLIVLDNKDNFDKTLDDFDIKKIDAERGIKKMYSHYLNSSTKRLENYFLKKNIINKRIEIKSEKLVDKLSDISKTETLIKIENEDLMSIYLKSSDSEYAYVSFDDKSTYKISILDEDIKKAIKIREKKIISYDAKQIYKTFDCKNEIEDINILAYLLSSQTNIYSIEYLFSNYLHIQISSDNSAQLFDNDNDIISYSALMLRLYDVLFEKINENGLTKIYEDVEKPLVKVVLNMEKRGILIDRKKIMVFKTKLEEEKNELEEKIYEMCKTRFNIQSTKQLQDVLINKLNISLKKKNREGFSVDSEVLEEIKNENPVIELILEDRKLSKLLSSYTSSLLSLLEEDDTLHTTFLQTGTATGRFSSFHPNLQNIPVRTNEGNMIRSAFKARENCTLISADYKQIELAVLAHLSKDEKLLEYFNNDIDIHKALAAEIFKVKYDAITEKMRRLAKIINFGIIYGMSKYQLSKEAQISTSEASSFIDSYFDFFKNVKEYKEQELKIASEKKYTKTIMGRIRYCSDINSENTNIRNAAMRSAFNSIIQGSAADILKVAMLKVEKALNDNNIKNGILLTVHDELIFEIRNEDLNLALQLISENMTNAVELLIPLRIKIKSGTNWGELE